MRIENHIIIQKPLPEVFAFIADFRHMPLWNYYIVETQQVSEGAPTVGTRYHQRRKTDVQQFQIITYQPDQVVAIQLERPTLPVRIEFTFAATAAGTKLYEVWELWPRLAALAFLIRPFTAPVQRAVAANLSKLKILLESGQVELQDGRISTYP
jgi:uncharacterized membrane protein